MLSIERCNRNHLRGLTVASMAGAMLALALARFGLPPFDLHTPLHRAGIMDPFCGMTRAARYLAQLRLRDALRYNPASPALPLAAIALWVRAVYGRWTGDWITIRIQWSARLVVPVVLAVALLEVHQQMNAALLR